MSKQTALRPFWAQLLNISLPMGQQEQMLVPRTPDSGLWTPYSGSMQASWQTRLGSWTACEQRTENRMPGRKAEVCNLSCGRRDEGRRTKDEGHGTKPQGGGSQETC